ncbi:MAG: M28 family peptidase [Chloroflexota bacterium]
MQSENMSQISLAYLKTLCQTIPERCVGSEGNRQATRFFADQLTRLGWQTEAQPFEALDWEEAGASLQAGDQIFSVFVSPYSLGCEVRAPLIGVSRLSELETADLRGKIVLLYGDIAKEQLMPKNFVFYNPEEHQRIVALLERGMPQALVCATGRNAAVAGGVYPFPLIEDGDFDIPSVYMTEEEGKRLLQYVGQTVVLVSKSRRIPATGENILGRKGNNPERRIVMTAHIDAKKGSPGAIDNATGVVVLLLVAQLLQDYSGDPTLELVAFNGEDYYAASGQMVYIQHIQGRFSEIALNINIDGAGYKEGKSAFSFFNLPVELERKAHRLLTKLPGITQGAQWIQGDHSIFIQYGVPAIAISSQWFLDHLDSQEITHTPKDNIEIVDPHKLVEIAVALQSFLTEAEK